jgi:acylglycerol lipase
MTSSLDIRGAGDACIALRSWDEPEHVKASVLIVHGLAEHSGRYEHVGAFLSEHGYRVRALDLPGCGHSGGRRSHMESIAEFHAAIEPVLEELASDGHPVVLYGHSNGGLTCLTYALSDRTHPDLLVLSAPALDADLPKLQRKLAPLLRRISSTLSVSNPVDGEHLSHDPAVGEAYFADPLVHTSATVGYATASFDAMAYAKEHLHELAVPTYVFHGGQDALVPPQFSAPLGDVEGVTRRLWPTLRHETHNEPEWEAVLGEVVDWLDEQV